MADIQYYNWTAVYVCCILLESTSYVHVHINARLGRCFNANMKNQLRTNILCRLIKRRTTCKCIPRKSLRVDSALISHLLFTPSCTGLIKHASCNIWKIVPLCENRKRAHIKLAREKNEEGFNLVEFVMCLQMSHTSWYKTCPVIQRVWKCLLNVIRIWNSTFLQSNAH